MRVKTTRSSEYFAALTDPIQLADEMQEKIRVWREWCGQHGLMGLWQKKLKNYYGVSAAGHTSQAVRSGGTQGELSMIKVNDLRNLIQNQLVMVTSQRPAGIARAVNADVTSLKASRIGTAIAEYYMNQLGFETRFVTATEIALLCDEAYIDLFWDKAAGDPIAVDFETGRPEMSGDCMLRTHAPWNVARDPGLTVEQQRWNIISYRMNKWDAAASYPRFRDSILSEEQSNFPELPMEDIPDGSDTIFGHLLVHDRTSAVPEGRYALMIGNNIVMDSTDESGGYVLPYAEYPVERIAPSDVIDGPIGYSAANDILALEEVTDALNSIATTNSTNFGGQCLVGPEGANIKVSEIAKGARYFELPPDQVGLLRPLDLLHTPPEIFNYIGMLNQKKEQAVGVNAVIRGNPAEAGMSGASGSALALIQTQAISFNSGIQRSYFALLSGTMTKLIGILRVYADTPRVAKIVGKSKASGLKEFKYTGHDLNSISSIVYEMVNPVSQSLGGRLTFAQDLLKSGLLKNPKQYINVVTTGQTDALIDDDEADQLLILQENEWLVEGKPFQAIITENHQDHLKGHMSVLSSLEAKSNPKLVADTLAHCQEHIDLWMQASQTNPGLLVATAQQPLMPPPPAQGAQAPGGLPGEVPAIGQMTGNGQNPSIQKAEEVRAPGLPNIAGTNQRPTVPGVTDTGLM
jgi:hypothetical protein